MGKSKATVTPQLSLPQLAAQIQAIQGLGGLAGQFPAEWFQENIMGSLGGYMDMLKRLGEEGAYSPEEMQRIYQTALAPGVDIARRNVQDVLGRQVQAGRFRPGTAAETAAQNMSRVVGEAWKQVPELTLKGLQAQLQGMEGLKAGTQLATAPQTYQKSIYESLGGVGAAYPSGTTTTQPRSLWGIPLG